MPRKATPGPRIKHPAVSVTFEKDALRSSPAKWLQSPEDVAVVNDYDKDGRPAKRVISETTSCKPVTGQSPVPQPAFKVPLLKTTSDCKCDGTRLRNMVTISVRC